MTNQLKQLSEAATQGEWVPDVEFGETITFSDPVASAAFKEEANVALICALVNAYRAGELIPAEEARAREAVAYEAAAKAVEPYYNDLDGNRVPILGSPDAAAIRALTPDHTTTALEQIRQQARDEGKREALEKVIKVCNQREREWDIADMSGYANAAGAITRSISTILATLSADTPTT